MLWKDQSIDIITVIIIDVLDQPNILVALIELNLTFNYGALTAKSVTFSKFIARFS